METCKSVCGDEHCKLPEGHKGKHADLGTADAPRSVRWTDGGAQRVNDGLAKKAAS